MPESRLARARVLAVPVLATVIAGALALGVVGHYFLASGIVLVIAFGVLTHQLRVSFGQARALAEGNRSLAAHTDQRRKLNELLEARVAERTEELETWAHSFSHDLKSPLGAIMNFSSILDEDYRDRLDDEGRDILDRIRRSAARAASL